MSHRDHAAFILATLLHALLGGALAMAPHRSPRAPRIVTVDVRRPPPPPLPPPPVKVAEPEPPPPPEPPRPRKKEVVAKAPRPNQTDPPKEPPKEPPKPIFGVTMASVTESDSSFTVPVGNTTMTDPKNVGKPGDVAPLPAVRARPAGEFVAASPFDVTSAAEVLEDPISATSYPDGEAKNLGLEGQSILRLEIDLRGRVHGVRIVKSVGGGAAGATLDKLAQRLAYKMRFRPCRGRTGAPLPCEQDHPVQWILDR